MFFTQKTSSSDSKLRVRVSLVHHHMPVAFSRARWSHEYQEATIEKILRFLKGHHDQVDIPATSKGQKKKE